MSPSVDPIGLIVALLVLLLLTTIAFGVLLMTLFQEISAAQSATAQAIADLAARAGSQSGITTAEADQILAAEQANAAAVAAILP